MTDINSQKLVLHSSFEEIHRLGPFLETIQTQAGYSDEQFSPVTLAVNEAVTNAIFHGNKEDESKKVYISASIKNNVLQINVQDEGAGFDPSSLPDPLQEDNLLKDSGRGVFLIKQYSDKVEFSENATKLTMFFTLDNST